MTTPTGYKFPTTRRVPAMEEVAAALRQGDKQARIAAVHQLGRMEGSAASAALVSALKSPDPDVRALAMGKLAFCGGKGAVAAVTKGLDDPDPRVRQNAIYALRRLGVKSAADRVALLLNSDAADVVRLNAAQALSALGSRKQARALVNALGDTNPNVVFAALRALATLAPADVHKHVLQLVHDARRWGRTPETQRDVILRMLQNDLKKKAVADCLRKVVREGLALAKKQGKRPTALELREAASLLSVIGDATGVPVLLDALQGGEYGPQVACEALARLRVKEAVPLILAGPMKNGFYPTMLRAVRALGEIGDVRALPALAALFNDRVDDFPVERSLLFTKDNPDLRLTALVAMEKVAVRNLVEAAHSSDAFQRKLAGELLRAS